MAGQMKQQLETFDGTSNRSAYAPSESLVGKGERAWLQQITDLNRIQAVSYNTSPSPRDATLSRMSSSA